MPYTLSQEIQPLKRSVMRDLLKLAVSPEIISLAGGLPANEYLPVDAFQQCLTQVLARDGARAMQYSPMHEPLREWLAAYMRERGVACTPENIFLTNGCQQGQAIISRLFLDPGDMAVIEDVTFTGIQQVTVGRGARVLTVPTNLHTGVDVDALEKVFRKRPKLAILIPDFHNPLGVSISQAKREQIAALAAQYQVPIVEDDPYSPLRFEGDALPPIKAFDTDGWVFYLGSFSKMLAPAMRLGWIVAPNELIPKITVMRESFDLEGSTLIQRAVTEFLVSGALETHLAAFNPQNRTRRDKLLTALDTHFGKTASWTIPQGGLFSWVTLPDHVDTWERFSQAVEQKVAYIPGSAFSVHGQHRNTMRLNFSNVALDKFDEGVARLAQVLLG
jgi:2-aminoadipate transaminase